MKQNNISLLRKLVSFQNEIHSGNEEFTMFINKVHFLNYEILKASLDKQFDSSIELKEENKKIKVEIAEIQQKCEKLENVFI